MGDIGLGLRGAHAIKLFFARIGMVLVLCLCTSAEAIEGEDLYCLYQNQSFQGQKICGTKGTPWLGYRFYNVPQRGVNFYKKASSLQLKDGYELVAFSRIGYWGNYKVFSGDHTSLDNWDKRIASFYLRRAKAKPDQVCFYSRKHYQGRRFCTTRNQHWLPWFWNNQISSVSIPTGYTVTLRSRWWFYGNTKQLASSTADLGNFNNLTSSLRIQLIDQPADGDGDGVDDSRDLCEDTAAGQTVNQQGCAANQLDTDNDGVNNSLDQCPATAVTETANAAGCGPSQLDEDSDGVTDLDDQCPSTDARAMVNVNGCAQNQLDADGDGVDYTLDQCASTPLNELVNAAGCGFSQLDLDGDGITDNADQCPVTDREQAVDDVGCAAHQSIDTNDIVLLSPQADAVVMAGKILVTGTVAWPDELGVTVNGNVAMVDRSQSPAQFATMLEVSEGQTEIVVIATNQYGRSATLSTPFSATPNADISAELVAHQGFTPFTAAVQFSTTAEIRLISIEIDFDGDAKYEIEQHADVGSYLSIENAFEHVYVDTGLHFISARVQDENGQYYDFALVANVIDKALLISQLSRKWNAINNAMIGANVKLALLQLSLEAAPQYQEVFQALQPEFAKIVSEYSTLDCEDVTPTFASCGVARTNSDSGKRTLHFINYVVDGRGLWKVSGL